MQLTLSGINTVATIIIIRQYHMIIIIYSYS